MARKTIAQLTADLSATRSELCRLEAVHEALGAENDALRSELRNHKDALQALSEEFVELQDRAARQQRDVVLIHTRGELMAKMRQLNREGVPCFMRGDFIYHAQTRAILAQREMPL